MTLIHILENNKLEAMKKSQLDVHTIQRLQELSAIVVTSAGGPVFMTAFLMLSDNC